MSKDDGRIVHRATYTLERGSWRGACRICGWEVSDPDRRRAVARYRAHIRSTSGASLADEVLRVPERMVGVPDKIVALSDPAASRPDTIVLSDDPDPEVTNPALSTSSSATPPEVVLMRSPSNVYQRVIDLRSPVRTDGPD